MSTRTSTPRTPAYYEVIADGRNRFATLREGIDFRAASRGLLRRIETDKKGIEWVYPLTADGAEDRMAKPSPRY